MRRLTVKDARWLNLETPSRPMHTLKIAVLQPPPGTGYEELIESARERVKLVPTLRWRLAFGPGRIGRPYWVEDEAFDLERHLVRKRIAAPGGRRELCELVARAAEAPLLDRSLPLWQFWVVEGLADGRMAIIGRVHHAFADGVSFARILAGWVAPELSEPVAPPGDAPSGLAFVARMLTAGSREQLGATAGFVRAARAAQRSPAPEIPPAPFSGRTLSGKRTFACEPLPLDAVHRVRKALGATVNDLLVALIAAALRSYLDQRGGVPADPLVAMMPVSLLPVDEQEPVGNRGLATTALMLPTDVADPVARVGAARANAKLAKQELTATAGARIDDAVDLLPRPAVRAATRLLDSSHGPQLGNLTLSNVRGPAEPLTSEGYLIEDFFSVGPCGPGLGLNITAWTYSDRFNVALVADAAMIADPWEIVGRVREELDRLEAAL